MKRKITKTIAVAAAICMTSCCLLAPNRNLIPKVAFAKTLAEIEAEKKDKQFAIDQKKQELAALAADIAKKEEYQAKLQEQIDLINSKMLLIDTQLQSLNSELTNKQAEVDQLMEEIAEQENSIQIGLTEFKKRIRTLYIYGNDDLLSALVGATDFYDVLAKIDLINRIAKHDDKMVEDLKEELQNLSDAQQDLTARMQALSIKQTEVDSLRKEFADSRAELDAAYQETEEAKKELEQLEQAAKDDLSGFQQQMNTLESEENFLIQEEARKRAEEEARKKAEYEAYIASSIAQSKWLATSTSNNGGGSTPTPTTPTPTPPAQPDPPAYTGGMLAWPAPGFYHISSGFGSRWGSRHNGIDIAGSGIHYASACAAAAGTVTRVKTGCSHDYSGRCGCNGGFGNYIMIDHGGGLSTLYAHLASVNVSVGQRVSTGTVVGRIGATGNSVGITGYHLHFSVLLNGTYVNPTSYLY